MTTAGTSDQAEAARAAAYQSGHASADGYITVLSAERGETVRAEPFADLEVAVATLLGDNPP